MNRVRAFLEAVSTRIRATSATIGQEVEIDASVLDRSGDLTLAPPGLWSPNGSCRLLRTKDGWIAANLPREDDIAALPALLQADVAGDPWDAFAERALDYQFAPLMTRAELMGLAIATVGETQPGPAPCRIAPSPGALRSQLRVLDFSSLWAGPLCGSIFAALGAEVAKLESIERPDTTALATPQLDLRLNGAKLRNALAITTKEGRAELLEHIARSDVLITSARTRALEALGLTRASLSESNPKLIWIAISGHGGASNRVGFGDDAAAAGGLLAWERGEPRFIGDALADPITGLAAAAAALDLIVRKQAGFIDASLAHAAAFVARS
jgi:hypothetical protein